MDNIQNTEIQKHKIGNTKKIKHSPDTKYKIQKFKTQNLKYKKNQILPWFPPSHLHPLASPGQSDHQPQPEKTLIIFCAQNIFLKVRNLQQYIQSTLDYVYIDWPAKAHLLLAHWSLKPAWCRLFRWIHFYIEHQLNDGGLTGLIAWLTTYLQNMNLRRILQ